MKQIELNLDITDLRMMQFAPINAKNSKVKELLNNAVIESEDDVPYGLCAGEVDEGVTRYNPNVYDKITSFNSENDVYCHREVYLTDNTEDCICLTITDEDGNETKYENLPNERKIHACNFTNLLKTDIDSFSIAEEPADYLADFLADDLTDDVTDDITSSIADYIEDSIEDVLTEGATEEEVAKASAEIYARLFAKMHKMTASDIVKIRNIKNSNYDRCLPNAELFKRLKNDVPDSYTECFMRVHIKSMLNECEIPEDYDAVLLRSSIIGKGSVTYQIELEDDEDFDINKLHFIFEEYWWDDDYADTKGFLDTFEHCDLLLDFIIYDGKIIGRRTDVNWQGVEAFGNTVLMNYDMTKYE